jgi:DNA replication protein DnaC
LRHDELERKRCEENEKRAGEIRAEWLKKVPSALRLCGVPRRFLLASAADLAPNLSALLAGDEKNLFLTGVTGSGKTHLAVAAMRAYLERLDPVIEDHETGLVKASALGGLLPRMISAPEFLLAIRRSFNREASEDADGEGEILDSYSEVEFLVIDDLGAEKASEWSIQMLYLLIDRRYRDAQRTIVTSNLGLDEIELRLSDRIASRIAGMCDVVALDGPDRRLTREGGA